MKKSIITVLCFIFYALSGYSQDFPAKSSRLVNDYTNTLSADQTAKLEQKLVAFDDSTSTQIAVVMLKSVGDYDINDYALQLGRQWGIGNKGKNNGVLVLVALGDRKISIQTGYGVEGALPDMYAKRIIEEDIKPHFKSGNYYEGLEAGTDAIIGYTKGEYKNDKPRQKQEGAGLPGVFVLVIIVVVIIIILRKGGGGGGGNGQVIGGRGVADALFWSMLLGGGRGSGGRSGGFGGGSGGGGGFGGFGGGSFGGGGSSGSW